MEKIININMAGRVIAIEDSAYTSLKSYLESLKNYFAGEEGGDEIMNDIESRVAELMADKIRRGSVAINTSDIDEIVGSIGRVEDFVAADDEPSNPHMETGSMPPPRSRSKKFYRDTNDKIAGGVCSGLAAYLNLDPALVRIVFAILALGGWGSGLLLYLVLWIFVPAAPLEGYVGRRLFRDPEDKWLGGVCSGIAAYFDREPWIFRLAFALPFLLSMFSGTIGFFMGSSLIFGSFTGTFFLIYIVLWIVLPLATTDFDRMEMRGEKVDLNSIRNNVMADIKDKAKTFSGEVTESASRFSGEARSFMNTRGRAFAQEAREAARPIAARGGHIIGTILKAFFMFIGSIIAFALFIVVIVYCFGFSHVFNDFILRTSAQRTLGWVTVFLFFGVPLLGLVTMMVRRAMRMRTGGRYFALGYSLLWVAGWVCLIFLASDISKEFSRTEYVSQDQHITQPAGNRMIVAVPAPGIEYSNSLPWLRGNIEGWDISNTAMQVSSVMVIPALSPDSQYHVIMKRSAMGRNMTEASGRAENISYHLQNLSDSVLSLDNGFSISKADGYRAQRVIVEVQVPAGKKIRFDESVEEKLNSFNVPVRQRYSFRPGRWEARWDEDLYDEWNADVDYTMSEKGVLLDPSGHEVSSRYYNRWERHHRRHDGFKLDSLDRAIEEIERQQNALDDEREN